MDRHLAYLNRQIGTVLACCTGLCLSVHAAPPLTKTFEPVRPALKLDLRAPAAQDLDDAKRFSPLGPAGDDARWTSLHMAAEQDRAVGRVQAFAERFHREGLPVARLWESHSALVSLGLNSKGKPGIWLVQKTH